MYLLHLEPTVRANELWLACAHSSRSGRFTRFRALCSRAMGAIRAGPRNDVAVQGVSEDNENIMSCALSFSAPTVAKAYATNRIGGPALAEVGTD